RRLALPDRLVDWAVLGAILGLEQPLDLLVGLIDGPGPPGLLLRLAAQPQGRLGKTLLAFARRRGAHARLLNRPPGRVVGLVSDASQKRSWSHASAKRR